MKRINGCADAQKLGQHDENLELHIAGCAECRQSQRVGVWMQKFAAATEPSANLPAPGFLLFKARLLKKQSAAERAVQPIVWMRIIAVVLLAATTGWLLIKSEAPTGSIVKETIMSFSPVAPLFFFVVIGAALFCLAFAYFLREAKTSENKTLGRGNNQT